MQTRTYGDLFHLITNMIGAVELASDEQTQVKNFINRRFQEAFDTSPVWPRYIVTGEERNILSDDVKVRNFIPNTSFTNIPTANGDYTLLGTGNGSGEELADTSVYSHNEVDCILYRGTYLSVDRWIFDIGATATEQGDGTFVVSSSVPPEVIEAGAVKQEDVLNVTSWTDQLDDTVSPILSGGVGKKTIPYAQAGSDTIGEFNRVHRKEPFARNSAIEYDFYADEFGANILNVVNTTDSTAFVTYKKPFTPFSVTTDFYNSTATVPAEFFNYIAHSVYADFLRVQNKQEEAIAEENVGAKYLAQELEKVDIRMNNSTINKRFSTYVSRQSR